jgi:hypothetical protein
MLDRFKKWFFKPSHHFQIRYNTKNDGGPLVWRVISNGQEMLASRIEIRGYMYGETSWVDGERKINIACDGRLYWNGTDASIITGKAPDLLP